MLLKSIDSDPPSLNPCLPPSVPPFLPLQLYESDLQSSPLLAEEYAPIPDPEHTSATPTVVAGYQFSCNKTAGYTHTAVGSGEWNTIFVYSHFIPLSGNEILCCMQLYKAVCILIHPLLPLSLSLLPSLSSSLPPSLFHPPVPLCLLSSSSSSQVSPTPPSRCWYSGDIWCAKCGGVLGSGGG